MTHGPYLIHTFFGPGNLPSYCTGFKDWRRNPMINGAYQNNPQFTAKDLQGISGESVERF